MKTTLFFPAVLAAISVAAPVRAEADIRIDDAALQRMMGETLRSVSINVSSGGGAISLRLPNGTNVNSPVRIPVVTIGMPDPWPGIVASTNTIRNDGAPTLNYRDGRLRFALSLRPQDTAHTINTSWTSGGFWLPDVPGVGVSRIQVQGSFRLVRQGNVVALDDFQLQAAGDWQIRGLLNRISGLFHNQINTAVGNALAAELRPRLNLVVQLSVVPYLQQTTGYGNTLMVGNIAHNSDHIAITVTGRSQRPAITIPTLDGTQINPDALNAVLLQSSSHDSAAKKKEQQVDAENQKALDSAKANAKVELTPKQKAALEEYNKAAGAGGGAGKSGKG
ncbi:hypothetical protein [Armatimonas rosea]|uniref:Uncharacterized protein n=1 Tax=Armatimonas rosea TaxID=685828 RepID=A0A7W9W939_ARMRO|nr:hypothetical protein [Armatimonas rosea]MBB6053433.1 hypothetical protein [Armatimonas rosea]